MNMAISVRIPRELAEQVDGIAAETERSRSFIVQKALESYIEDYADLQVAPRPFPRQKRSARIQQRAEKNPLAYNLLYKKSVSRDLKKLGKAETGRILNEIDRELPQKADSCPALHGKFAGLRKYRIGDYRVIFSILGKDIIVLRIGHRRDVYKKRI